MRLIDYVAMHWSLLMLWHLTDKSTASAFVCFWGNSGHAAHFTSTRPNQDPFAVRMILAPLGAAFDRWR